MFLANAHLAFAQNIDYRAVQAALDRASRPTFGQRLADYLSTPLLSTERVQLSTHFGLAYTRETNAALSLGSTLRYHTSTTAPQSTLKAAAMASVSGYYRVQLSGEHLFGVGESRIIYDLGVGSLPVRFWGLGYDAATTNARSEYTRRSSSAAATYLHHIAAGLHLGIGANIRYGKGTEIEALSEQYLTEGGQTTRHLTTTALLLTARFDRRDNPTSAQQGVYLSLTGEMRPKGLGTFHSTLWHVEAQANYYQPLWEGGVAAIDLYGDLWSSATPWLYWPSLGGENRMRGYYYGRYTDRKMLTAQLELRQTVYGPVGVVVWGGAGNVFSSLKTFDWGHTLPNGGVGLRLKVDGRTMLRVDYGFGRKCGGLIINVNEAF